MKTIYKNLNQAHDWPFCNIAAKQGCSDIFIGFSGQLIRAVT